MKQNEIQIGATYTAKVSGKLTTVKILREHRPVLHFHGVAAPTERHGGWDAINVATKREIHIRGAQRLRQKVEPLAFYRSINPTLALDSGMIETHQISRAEAVALVYETFGVGTWLENLRKMRSPEGLEIKGGTLHARPEAK